MLLSILIEVKRARGAKGHYIPKLLELLDDKLRRSGCQITWIWPKCSVFLATVKRYINTGGVLLYLKNGYLNNFYYLLSLAFTYNVKLLSPSLNKIQKLN